MRLRALWIQTLDVVTHWPRPLQTPSSPTSQGTHRFDLKHFKSFSPHVLWSVPLTAICHRSTSAAEDESFENNLEQQLEDELKLEELMKHRQEPDKACMVSLWQSIWIIKSVHVWRVFAVVQVTLQQWLCLFRWLVSSWNYQSLFLYYFFFFNNGYGSHSLVLNSENKRKHLMSNIPSWFNSTMSLFQWPEHECYQQPHTRNIKTFLNLQTFVL